MSLSLRYAARSHVGLIRDGNEDSGYAGPRLLMVADGMGGQAAGELASSVAVQTLAQLDSSSATESPEDPIQLLGERIYEAHTRLRDMVAENAQLEGMGTTLTALLFAHGQLAVAHIGDSRAYRLRDGRFEQLTTDHTWVQRLVDEGRISAEEAGHHPQRSLLMRALDGRGQAEPDLTVIDVRAGDRFLLCSDGLCGVVSFETIESAVAGQADIHAVAESLIQLALRGGGPDNITCIVADVVQEFPPAYLGDTLGASHSGQFPTAQSATTQYLEMPMAVGAAAEHGPGGLPVFGGTAPLAATVPTARSGPSMPGATQDDSIPQDTPASRAARLRRKPAGAHSGGQQPAESPSTAVAQEQDEEPAGTEWAHKEHRRRWRRPVLLGGIGLLVVVGLGTAGYVWTQQQYYVADSNGNVAIFQGINTSLAGFHLSHVVSSSPKVVVADLPFVKQDQVKGSITASNLADAQSIVATLQSAAQRCVPKISIPFPSNGITPDTSLTPKPTATATPGSIIPSARTSKPATPPATTPPATPTPSASPTATAPSTPAGCPVLTGR